MSLEPTIFGKKISLPPELQTLTEADLGGTINLDITKSVQIDTAVDKTIDRTIDSTLDSNPIFETSDDVIEKKHSLQFDDSFELQEPLGEGGMGIVFSARQSFPPRHVAIKKLKESKKRARSRLYKEAQVLGRLEHPNIIPIYQVHENKTRELEVVFRKIKGKTFGEILQNKPQRGDDLLEALKILIQVCHGLEYAHSEGVLHRDIKPDNIMIGKFNQVYVMDWGLAIEMDDAQNEEKGFVGTPAYISLEMCYGEPALLTPATDVYLLGATLHKALTGKRYNKGKSIKDILQFLQKDEPHKYSLDVPRGLADLCKRACRRDIKDRIQTVQEFRLALENYFFHWEAVRFEEEGLSLLKRYKEALKAAHSSQVDDSSTLDIDIPQMHSLSKQAKKLFERALEVWPKAQRAKIGLEDIVILMIEQAILEKDINEIERLRSEGIVDWKKYPELEKQIKELQKQQSVEQMHIKELKKHSKEFDPTKTFAPRFLLRRIVFGVGAAMVLVLVLLTSVLGVQMDTNARLYPILLTGIPMLSTIAWLRKPLTINEYGRRATQTIVMVFIGLTLNIVACQTFGIKAHFLDIMDSIVYGLVFLSSYPALKRAKLLAGVSFLSAILCILFPEQSTLFPQLAVLIIVIDIYLEWGENKYLSEDMNSAS